MKNLKKDEILVSFVAKNADGHVNVFYEIEIKSMENFRSWQKALNMVPSHETSWILE